ncbi:MAG: hypothetical protein HYT79_11700 [Elusimicrobia bacterium]|nr:hypothetical protein [Elusimicrobiota bacterium]
MSRRLSLLILLLKIGSASCFLYSGALAAKMAGPDVLAAIKEAMKKMQENDTSDPLALAMKERDAARANRRNSASSSKKSGKEDWESASLKRDDPYQYVKGGQGGKKKKGEDEEAAAQGEGLEGLEGGEDQVASAKPSLWDTNQMGSGGFGGVSGFGGAGNDLSAGAGTSAGPQQALGDQLKAGEAAMGDGTGGLGASGGKSVRSMRAGIKSGSNLRRRGTGSAKGNLRGATSAGRAGNRAPEFQQAGGFSGAAFGEGGRSGRVLNVPGGNVDAGGGGGAGGDVDGIGRDLDSDIPVDLDPVQDESNIERDTEYDWMNYALAGMVLAAVGIGIALIITAPQKDAAEKSGVGEVTGIPAWWWTMYAIGAALLLAVMIWSIALLGSDSQIAKGIGMTFLMMAIPAILGWIALAVVAASQAGMIGELGKGGQTVLGALQGGVGPGAAMGAGGKIIGQATQDSQDPGNGSGGG